MKQVLEKDSLELVEERVVAGDNHQGVEQVFEDLVARKQVHQSIGLRREKRS